MSIIVQKYGGSSLGDAVAILRVARRIADCIRTGNRVVAVVSAMGDTTDKLISLAQEVSKRPDRRELDVLLSTGELVSCTLVAMALRSIGQDAISLSGAQAGIRTNTTHGKAKIAVVEPRRVMEELNLDKAVIVAGFQGITDHMDVTTLGRGASDLSAVALAASLGADRCEVYTDVDGIHTADPRFVPDSRKLDEVGFDEMLEMASFGAKMDPRSIEMGMTYGVPIVVASSFTNSKGTLIYGRDRMKVKVGEIQNKVSAIVTDQKVAKITVLSVADRPGIAAGLFGPLAVAEISVDEIVQNASVDGSTDLTFTVDRTDLDRAADVVEALAPDMGGTGITTAANLSKVSIVGTGMLDTPGYAATMFRALANASINIEMITTSQIRITCIIDELRLPEATRVLHAAFRLDQPG